MKIGNAKDIKLNQNSGTMPDVSDALLDWFQKMTFTTVVKTIVDFQVVETPTDVDFIGVWQPFGPRQLQMLPEGERQWKWFTCHSQIQLPLTPDQVITYLDTQYRVKDVLDYSLNGYYEYHLVEDYEGSGP